MLYLSDLISNHVTYIQIIVNMGEARMPSNNNNNFARMGEERKHRKCKENKLESWYKY